MPKLSDYFYKLSNENQLRYLEKIIPLGGVDPYTLRSCDLLNDKSKVPILTKDEITQYLLMQVSPFTQKEMRAYKSLDAFIKVACGWVKNIQFKYFDDSFVLIIGKVLHSQRLNETPLRPWVILQNANIVFAHCICVAGLGETCFHAAAILFALITENESVTDVLAYWTKPSGSNKNEQYKTVEAMDWRTPQNILDNKPENLKNIAAGTPPMSADEISSLLTEMKDNNEEAALMRIVFPFCDAYTNDELPKPLSSLSVEEYCSKSLEEILDYCSIIDTKITEEECKSIENASRKQSKSKEWFEQRSGRITASNFKAVCRTSITKPALSLIKKICYPLKYTFQTAATKYGCEHENEAANYYFTQHKDKHENLKMEASGLIINSTHPYFGASPDQIISCTCCGKGCLEIKCPYCLRDSSLEEVPENKLCFTAGTKEIDENHTYFYQVQIQMALTETSYADFVVWGKKNVIIQRIKISQFFWLYESEKAKLFFKKVILPELVSRFFTQKSEK